MSLCQQQLTFNEHFLNAGRSAECLCVHYLIQSSHQPCEVGTRISPLLEMRLNGFPNKTPLTRRATWLGELKALGERQAQ